MKKHNLIRKLSALAAAGAMLFSLAACSGSPATTPSTGEETLKVAIIKQLDHASLDEIANAVAARFDEDTAAGTVKVEYEISSGQNARALSMSASGSAAAMRT